MPQNVPDDIPKGLGWLHTPIPPPPQIDPEVLRKLLELFKTPTIPELPTAPQWILDRGALSRPPGNLQR